MGGRHKKKKKRKRVRSPEDLPDGKKFSFMSYEITDEPIRTEGVRRLPPDAVNKLEELYHKVLENPSEITSQLLEFKNEYPDTPVIYNYLFNAYAHSGDIDRAEALNRECVEKFPDIFLEKSIMHHCA